MRSTASIVGFATIVTIAAGAAPASAAGPGWHDPTCAAVTGDGSVSLTRNQGRTIYPTSEALTPVTYTSGLVALDRPDTLLAMSNNRLLSSTDAGCMWRTVGAVSGSYVRLVAAAGGSAYAWDQEGHLARVTAETITPLTAPVTEVAGLGTDHADGDHLRIADGRGQLYDSRDGGRTWRPVGGPAGDLTAAYTAVFDPFNLNHVTLGGMTTGVRVTFNGGRGWVAATGLSASAGGNVNGFSLAISPAATNVVYAMGLDIAELDSGAPSGGRHIYRSTNGGRTFSPIVDHGGKITLPNGPVLVAHPTDPGVVYFVFGTSFMGYGTDIYRYDFWQRKVTIAHNDYDRVTAIAFHPRKPRVMYLGFAEER
ncbi:dispase autolysis-inducing protein [Actinomycetes bacterium KLBMP 9797]